MVLLLPRLIKAGVGVVVGVSVAKFCRFRNPPQYFNSSRLIQIYEIDYFEHEYRRWP